MPLRIVLLTPQRRFLANRSGLGYQVPLGLVFLGGPLLDAGHRVRLLDNDVLGWDAERSGPREEPRGKDGDQPVDQSTMLVRIEEFMLRR